MAKKGCVEKVLTGTHDPTIAITCTLSLVVVQNMIFSALKNHVAGSHRLVSRNSTTRHLNMLRILPSTDAAYW